MTITREQQNQEMSDYIDSFTSYISDYRSNLNKQGVWLFLATLGCWSVQNFALQHIAMLITLYIFLFNLLRKWDREGRHYSFKKAAELIEEKIHFLPDKSDQEFWLLVLSSIKKKQLSFINAVKECHTYIVSFTFYCMCYSEMIIEVLKKS